jgi:acetoin utilization deacetylase AcuC-like enzyme
MGFCLFNNVAIGARYAQQGHGIRRVLIADWDLHHGNGTQHAFEEDPSVLYFSTHQYPYYPGSGALQQAGRGQGKGFTLNVPLSAGHGDGDFIGIFQKILKPVALEFAPDLVLVSAGFDIYEHDPLGGMRVTAEGFGAMTRCLLDLADACCDGKLVVTLEGGYHLQGLRASVKAVLKEMAGLTQTRFPEMTGMKDSVRLEEILRKVVQFQKGYWGNLGT